MCCLQFGLVITVSDDAVAVGQERNRVQIYRCVNWREKNVVAGKLCQWWMMKNIDAPFALAST